ncbi:hypothetical protein [Acidisoma sp. C75]
MTKKQSSNEKPKSMRRGLVILSIAILWAAANQPVTLSVTSLIVWVLGIVTVGLLARAAFAVCEPLLKLGMASFLRLLQRPPQTARSKM